MMMMLTVTTMTAMMKMVHTCRTMERKPISALEIAKLYNPCPTLISLEGNFHFGERQDSDGCPLLTNRISFISSLKAAMASQVHIKYSTRKQGCQLWTGQDSLRGQAE